MTVFLISLSMNIPNRVSINHYQLFCFGEITYGLDINDKNYLIEAR